MYDMEKPNFESKPHGLAKQYEESIKGAVLDGMGVPAEELELLIKDQHGVYFSEQNPNTLCCLVLGVENGHLYLVTGEFSETDNTISDFKVTTIS
jgi:hypothetical protein